MRRLLRALAGLGVMLGVSVAAMWGLDQRAERALPVVAPLPLALPDLDTSVAVARVSGGSLLLRELGEGEVAGVRVEGGPLEAFAAHGLEGLQALRDAGPLERHPMEALLAPVDSPPPHIAAGNNFAHHQEEVGLHDAPELYPKMSRPTAWNAEVPYVARLDYEVELCGVTLDALQPGEAGPLGFVLCNDFTDRWTMLAELDPRTELGTTGFPEGKGLPGYLPTGPWMVIPEDPSAFTASAQLRLTVDGRVRQEDGQSLAIWQHERILEGAFERCDWDYRYWGEAVDWPACEAIPAGTLILGGTPSGVAFRPWSIWAGWKYLDPGALVVTEGTGLGRLENRVGAP